MARDEEFYKVRNINLEKIKKEKYDRLKADSLSLLKGHESADVFIQAMALGFKEGRKTKLDDPYPLINTVSISEDQEWLIKAIAISEAKTINILSDPKKMIKIAEEYANAGIDILHERIYQGGGEYGKRLEEELRSTAKNGKA